MRILFTRYFLGTHLSHKARDRGRGRACGCETAEEREALLEAVAVENRELHKGKGEGKQGIVIGSVGEIKQT